MAVASGRGMVGVERRCRIEVVELVSVTKEVHGAYSSRAKRCLRRRIAGLCLTSKVEYE